jgi:plastocyanin
MHKNLLVIIVVLIGLTISGYFIYFSLPPEILKEKDSEPVQVTDETPAEETPTESEPKEEAPVAEENTSNTINISYTNTGFIPANIEIKEGTKIVFQNASSLPMWIASNDHPTHSILPEFDQKTLAAPGSEYEFTFETKGVWPYHNHLKPNEGGTITVK